VAYLCSRSRLLVTLTFMFLMLQVKTCLPEFLAGCLSSGAVVRETALLLRLAGPPKMERNFLRE
jgi:hypothetical protein